MTVNTSFMTVYDTIYTYNATAGVGPFNASLIQPFMNALHSCSPTYPYEILPYTYYAAVYTLVLNPLISTISEPVSCQGHSCVSYLLSGGLEMVTPWTPDGHEDYPMVKIDKAPSLQMDFTAPASSSFQATECDVFGEYGFTIGIRLCISVEESTTELLRAGLFVCFNGIDGNNCSVSEPAPNITATLSVYTREATIIASRSN